MVPERALFQFDDFFIINFSNNFIDAGPQKKPLRIKEIMNSYLVELDFAFVDKAVDKKTLLYCKTSINTGEKKLPGYSIFAEGVAIFPMDLGRELSPQRYTTEIQAPAISQIINHIRNYILISTSQGPFGKYQYPLLDLGHIIKTKAHEIREARYNEEEQSKGI
jgi:hypothetical protein